MQIIKVLFTSQIKSKKAISSTQSSACLLTTGMCVCVVILFLYSWNTNLLVDGSITEPSTSHQTGFNRVLFM